jgi:hypothetical protein
MFKLLELYIGEQVDVSNHDSNLQTLVSLDHVSILIGYILLTKSLLCNVAAFTGMPYILESSDIQSLFI